MNSFEPRSSFPTSVHRGNTFFEKVSLRRLLGRRGNARSHQPTWKPPAYRFLPLLTAVLTSWTLIAILQILLARSERDGGILFSPTASTSDVPLSRSFLYLYLPTILALLYSIFWSWIDLQVKRLEPWWQLSKGGEEGVRGAESLLLSYPFGFMPFVPVSAVRRRHWAVFWAGTAVLVVTWFLVPLQAGIFATETTSRTQQTSFAVSTDFIRADAQNLTLTGRYIQSAHGIIWLNETLPPYMSRQYALTPFRTAAADNTSSQDVSPHRANETWTAETTLYSLDLNCETPKLNKTQVPSFSAGSSTPTSFTTQTTYMSSNGCVLDSSTLPRIDNYTKGEYADSNNQAVYKYKDYVSVYIGYHMTVFADYYLEGYCPENASHTFLVMYAPTKARVTGPPQNVTTLFCTPFYYQQRVRATVDAQTRSPVNVSALGVKQKLPAEKWDAEFFEYQMNSGAAKLETRGGLPLRFWPDQLEHLSTSRLSLMYGGSVLQAMAGLAIGAGQRALGELEDPEALGGAYEDAYRLIFARSMVEILDQKFSRTNGTTGISEFEVGVVVMVPAFTYVVEGLLGFISLCAIALLVVSMQRKWRLFSDPASVAAVMSLVAENRTLLEEFGKLDCAGKEDFEEWVRERKFRLVSDERGNVIVETTPLDLHNVDSFGIVRPDSESSAPPKPIRPREFRSFMVLPFVGTQIALAILLGVLLMKSQPFGIARPSNNPIIRQIVENYVPTAIATLIEPIWILVNRLLCMLQPLEELRGGLATAKQSIDADYSSLPPQLVIFRALRSRHFKLATVCLMALLANVLAVAFSGMFNEQSMLVFQAVQLYPPFESKFVAINGSVGPALEAQELIRIQPSGAYTGGLGADQFLAAESNYTAGTPMPPWTDDRFLYIPFADAPTLQSSTSLQARTQAFGARLECQGVDAKDYHGRMDIRLHTLGTVSDSVFNVTVDNGNGKRMTCMKDKVIIYPGPRAADETKQPCDTGKVAMELVLYMHAGQNASQAEKDFCLQTAFLAYLRKPDNMCSGNSTSTVMDKSNSVMLACRPVLVTGEADVRVNREGRVQEVLNPQDTSNRPADFLDRYFSNDANNLLEQAQGYLAMFPGATWHNDSFATDFLNYFMIQQSDSRLVDPNLPLPTLREVTDRLYPVYSKLFAIWLGLNKEKLLVPRHEASLSPITGQKIDSQVRIFVSKSLFVVAEIILGTYAFVAICIYLWRPGRFLARLPTSIAAIIALFAAGSAVRDMENTSMVTARQRRMHLEKLGKRYGYGTFVGSDGRTRVGIEKEPFVDAIPVHGVLQRIQTGLSQRSLSWKRDGG